jgi:hypothetical protein
MTDIVKCESISLDKINTRDVEEPRDVRLPFMFLRQLLRFSSIIGHRERAAGEAARNTASRIASLRDSW